MITDLLVNTDQGGPIITDEYVTKLYKDIIMWVAGIGRGVHILQKHAWEFLPVKFNWI